MAAPAGEAVLAGLVDHEPDADDEVVADRLANRLVHHQPEAAPVRHRAAEHCERDPARGLRLVVSLVRIAPWPLPPSTAFPA